MNSLKNIFLITLILLCIDFLFSKFFFKQTEAWKPNLYKEKPWRTISKYYHHDLLPNTNTIEVWGKNKQTLITNSLGFRDSKNRKVLKVSDKYRILLIGDSFIEGLGYDHEFILSGLLQNYYGSKYEILNSAVSSYSPSIYYYKTKYFIDKGYIFDRAVLFLDLSDVIDEMHLEYNDNGTLKAPISDNEIISLKHKIYNFSYYLRENFTIFRFISILSDKTEILKNDLKNRYNASKFFNKNFFTIDKEELILFKMIHVDRGNWTRNVNSYEEVLNGLESSEEHLSKLFNLLEKNKIESYLVVYPWPSQIFFGDEFHEKYWRNFSIDNKVNFISLYQAFDGVNKKEIILNNFIHGDIHWNKKGTHIVFQEIIDRL